MRKSRVRWYTIHGVGVGSTSLSSRNTLGDTTHNTKKIGLYGVVEVYGGQAYAEVMVVVDEEATVPK